MYLIFNNLNFIFNFYSLRCLSILCCYFFSYGLNLSNLFFILVLILLSTLLMIRLTFWIEKKNFQEFYLLLYLDPVIGSWLKSCIGLGHFIVFSFILFFLFKFIFIILFFFYHFDFHCLCMEVPGDPESADAASIVVVKTKASTSFQALEDEEKLAKNRRKSFDLARSLLENDNVFAKKQSAYLASLASNTNLGVEGKSSPDTGLEEKVGSTGTETALAVVPMVADLDIDQLREQLDRANNRQIELEDKLNKNERELNYITNDRDILSNLYCNEFTCLRFTEEELKETYRILYETQDKLVKSEEDLRQIRLYNAFNININNVIASSDDLSHPKKEEKSWSEVSDDSYDDEKPLNSQVMEIITRGASNISSHSDEGKESPSNFTFLGIGLFLTISSLKYLISFFS